MNDQKKIKLERYRTQILNLLREFLVHSVYDKIAKKAILTDLKLSNDYSYVTIYVSSYSREHLDKIVDRLNKIKGLFRSEIASNFDFYKTPTIFFKRDDVRDRVDEIESIFIEINRENNKEK